jgi:hypothetical protein
MENPLKNCRVTAIPQPTSLSFLRLAAKNTPKQDCKKAANALREEARYGEAARGQTNRNV